MMDCVLDGWLRPEFLEDRNSAADQGGIVTRRQGAGFLVGAAELMPGFRRPGPVAGDQEGIRLSEAVGGDVPLAGLPKQPGELAPLPPIAAGENEVTHCQRLLPGAPLVAFQERRLGTRRADRSQVQQ